MASKITKNLTMSSTADASGFYTGSTVLSATAYTFTLTRKDLPADVDTITVSSTASTSYNAGSVEITPTANYTKYNPTTSTTATIDGAKTITLQITADTSTEYTASVDASASSWCTVGADNKTFTVTKNEGSERTATITFSNHGTATASCVLTQTSGNGCSVTLNSAYAGTITLNGVEKTVTAGGSVDFTGLSADADYSYTFVPSQTDWYTITQNKASLSLGSGATTNNTELTYSDIHHTNSNTTESIHTSTVVGEGVTGTVTSHYGETAVTAASIETSGSEEITAVLDGSSYAVAVSSSKNLTTSSRSNTVTVYADSAKSASVTYTVTQAEGATCTFAIQVDSMYCSVNCNGQDQEYTPTDTVKTFTGFVGETYDYTVTNSASNNKFACSIEGLTDGGKTVYPISGSGEVTFTVDSNLTAYTINNTTGTTNPVTNYAETSTPAANIAKSIWTETVSHPDVVLSTVSATDDTVKAWFNPSLESGSQGIAISSESGTGTFKLTVPDLTETSAEDDITVQVANTGASFTYTFGREEGYLVTFNTNTANGTVECA